MQAKVIVEFRMERGGYLFTLAGGYYVAVDSGYRAAVISYYLLYIWRTDKRHGHIGADAIDGTCGVEAA